MAKILIACEESQATTIAFRKLGHEAFSCDLLPCSGGHPEWHYQCDIFEVINKGWDLMIAHPPCTFLTGSGVMWLSHPEDTHLPFEERRPNPHYPNRRQDMLDSVEFIKALYNCSIQHVVIENPVGLLSSKWKKPNQIIQPYMFGDEATKTTCLWLKNLPPLLPTKIVGKGERYEWVDGKSGKLKSQPLWYYKALSQAKTKQERQTLRSKTFQGMAEAFASQWGGLF
jgi:site-specific DNA-cytosine methylase